MIRYSLVVAIAAAAFSATPVLAEMKVQLQAPWTGGAVPAGQQCKNYGGKGATPPMKVSGLPKGTAAILVEYDDKTYSPLSKNGGHGTLVYPAQGATATLPAVPGGTKKLPNGVKVKKSSRANGAIGYLPPCSGGRGNTYTATLYALGADGKAMEKTQIVIGKY